MRRQSSSITLLFPRKKQRLHLRPTRFQPDTQSTVRRIAAAQPEQDETVGKAKCEEVLVLGCMRIKPSSSAQSAIASFRQHFLPFRDMNGFMPAIAQPPAQAGGKVRVDQKFHSAAAETIG